MKKKETKWNTDGAGDEPNEVVPEGLRITKKDLSGAQGREKPDSVEGREESKVDEGAIASFSAQEENSDCRRSAEK